jgi:hypothetical protein
MLVGTSERASYPANPLRGGYLIDLEPAFIAGDFDGVVFVAGASGAPATAPVGTLIRPCWSGADVGGPEVQLRELLSKDSDDAIDAQLVSVRKSPTATRSINAEITGKGLAGCSSPAANVALTMKRDFRHVMRGRWVDMVRPFRSKVLG